MELKIKWIRKLNLKTVEDVQAMLKDLHHLNPDYCSLDTETDGLHIKRNKPFLISFAFYNSKHLIGVSYTVDIELAPELYAGVMLYVEIFANKCIKTVMINATYDLHMLENIGLPVKFDNVTELQTYIRLVHDSVPTSQGGAPLGLKAYMIRYVTKEARSFERKLKEERTAKSKHRTRALKEALSGTPLPEELKITGKEKGWTIAIVEKFLKDKTNEIEDLPLAVQPAVERWLVETPDPDNYRYLNRDNVTEYAHYDVRFTLEIFERLHRQVISTKILKQEEDLIYPLLRMENVGFAVDEEYLLWCKDRVRRYIKNRHRYLTRLCGEKIKIGSTPQILRVLDGLFNIKPKDTDKADKNSLLKLKKQFRQSELHEIVDTIIELRSVEKWYSTYIIKWLEDIYEGRIYTQLNSSGAVSGRFTSDFQQFPSKKLYDIQGNELFNPRKIVKVSGGDYPWIAYLDYSQIELRFQALYTILVMGGDLNMCRAYMPYKCYTLKDGKKIIFDHNKLYHIRNFQNVDWFQEENDVLWHPTDLHSKTTKEGFHIDESHEDWKSKRKMGKGGNFAIAYGANAFTLEEQLDLPRRDAQAVYRGFKNAYPGVVSYWNYIEKVITQFGYLENLFGRRYNNITAHKGKNYLIQGSCADFLKLKIIEIDKFLRKNKWKTKMQMTIHDELSFEIHKDELHIIPILKHIMETWDDTLVPIVTDMELTSTSWADKEDYEPNK